jgi:DNA-binding response OmpR family regulator
MDKVRILIIDNDESSQSAMRQLLDSEGWQVQQATTDREAVHELAGGSWSLVVASIGTIGLSGLLYLTLKELAQAPLLESGKSRLRVLFVIPEANGLEARPLLESERLPYVLKPFHLHDFLERVSDLLMETDAITTPIRRQRLEWNAAGRNTTRGLQKAAATQPGARNQGMFANREDYGMSEEEIAEYEAQELQETLRKKKKKKDIFAG